jgi:hypothetical protein
LVMQFNFAPTAGQIRGDENVCQFFGKPTIW